MNYFGGESNTSFVLYSLTSNKNGLIGKTREYAVYEDKRKRKFEGVSVC